MNDVPFATTAPENPEPAEPQAEEPVNEVSPDGILDLKLFRPLIVNGKSLASIRFDFGGLSETDLADVEREAIASKDTVMKSVAFSHTYCMYIAARASGINRNDLKRLSAKDSYKIASAVQGFFMV